MPEGISSRRSINKRFIVFLVLGFCLLLLAVIYSQTSTSHAVHKCPSDLGQNVAHECLVEGHPMQRIERAANQYCDNFSNPMKNGRCKAFYKRGAMGVAFNAGEGGEMCRDVGGSSFVQKCRQAFQAGRDRFPPPGPDNRDADNPNRGASNPGGAQHGDVEPRDRGTHQCGKGDHAVTTRFDFGCVGDALPNRFANPIYDLFFSLIRFLTNGVGIFIVIMIIWAGIRYATSEGNPETTAQAKHGIQQAMIALFIYIFAFAIINFLVPGGLLN